MNKRLLFILTAIFATLFIFFNSFQNSDMSNKNSNFFVDIIEEIAEAHNETPSNLRIIVAVRKTAHVLEFALQAFLIAGCFNIAFRRRIIYVLFLGLLTACIDEYIQLFPDGRSSMIQDVFIDFLGTVFGVFIFGVLCSIKRKLQKG